MNAHQLLLLKENGGRGAQGNAVLPLGHPAGRLALQAGAHYRVGTDIYSDATRVVETRLNYPLVIRDGQNLETGGF